jgi:hypothetical protein
LLVDPAERERALQKKPIIGLLSHFACVREGFIAGFGLEKC